MIRLHIIAEGPTEGTFVEELIKPTLWSKNVYATCTLMHGDVRYPRVKGDILRFMKQDPGAYCTTFFDYYGLGRGFPAKHTIGKITSTREKKQVLEEAIRDDIGKSLGDRYDASRLIPYVQMHEFEALLFSDPTRFADAIAKPELGPSLRAIRGMFSTPEDINDNENTAPSKRILALYPGYAKPFLGNLAALEMGLQTIRDHCPLFNEWLTRLEQLGATRTPA